MGTSRGWIFIDEQGSFRLPEADSASYLYFPLVNEAGIYSSISPTLGGDLKADHNAFLLPPVSVEDLHTSRAVRNFWLNIEGAGAWCVAGASAAQMARRFTSANLETVTLEAGFLWQRVVRRNSQLGVQAVVTNFVPAGEERVELMQVEVENCGNQPLTFTPTAAIPLYGRSADNQRDHRHVTSLLHRTRCMAAGVVVRPTLSFDERGHQRNQLSYAVLGVGPESQESLPVDYGEEIPSQIGSVPAAASKDGLPTGFFLTVEDFIGEGGTLDWPRAVVESLPPMHQAGAEVDGYEALGGLRFARVTLRPGQRCAYCLILAIVEDENTLPDLLEKYGGNGQFSAWLERTQKYWQTRLDTLRFHSADERQNAWLRWVTLQPVLRRLFGNSFLPYHDYGRGGRGWRDLWQDILSLLLTEPAQASDLLYSNFAGVRLDGSNATIIGSRPGEFKADRNNIPRVWMDHGAWPLLTVQLYLDQSGDLAFLLRNQVYFKDRLIFRAQQVDSQWSPEQGTQQLTADGNIYSGTLLEHLLIQHLVPFFNVGEHNNILLEGADWNDGMDMARQRGESVAFSALYAGNLAQLGRLVRSLAQLGVKDVAIAEEMLLLLDRAGEALDYANPQAKRARLEEYFASTCHALSGRKVGLALEKLAADLQAKADWLAAHIRTQEWIVTADGEGWFNGYYDNDGQRVEGEHPSGARMTLTGQVFPLMCGIATPQQAQSVLQAAKRYLHDPFVGGYRLNSDFKEVRLNLGRCFGFAFGHKENGAMFSHMAVMYANALYRCGLWREGWQVLEEIYQQSQDFERSHMLPGLPEYFSARGRGMYPFLTGSASWYLLTLVTQAYGVQGRLGDLVLLPALVKEQFDAQGWSGIETLFAGLRLEVRYHNPGGLDAGQYAIRAARLDGKLLGLGKLLVISRAQLAELNPAIPHRIEVELG